MDNMVKMDCNKNESFEEFKELLKKNLIMIFIRLVGYSTYTYDFKKHKWKYESIKIRHRFGVRLDNKEKREEKQGTIPLKAEEEFASRLYFVNKLKKQSYHLDARVYDAPTTGATLIGKIFSWIGAGTFKLTKGFDTSGFRDHADNPDGSDSKEGLRKSLGSEMYNQISFAFQRLQYACEHPTEEYPEDAFIVVRNYHKRAVEQYKKMAIEGNIQAIRHLAELYYHGVWLKKDRKHALTLFNQTAKENDASSLLMLADLYYDGVEVEQDYRKAALLYRKYLVKAKLIQNREFAWYRLGVMYRDGKGMQKSEKRAALLFRMASRYRYEPATWEYLKCLYYGRGVKQDMREAFNLAINRASIQHQKEFVQIVEAETTPLDLEKLFRLGQLLKFMLPHRHWDNKYTEEEIITILRANQMICKAAEKGLIEAEETIAWIVSVGGGELGLPEDEDKAIEWYTKAANQGSDKSKYMLAMYYLNGTFEFEIEENKNKISLEKASYWFNQMSKEKQKEYSSIAKIISDAHNSEKNRKKRKRRNSGQ